MTRFCVSQIYGFGWKFLVTLAFVMVCVNPAVADSGETSYSEAEGSITLSAGPCTIEGVTAEVSFGAWEWDGYQYIPLNESGESKIGYRTTPPFRDASCNIMISTTGLHRAESDAADSIGPEYLAVKVDSADESDPVWVSFDSSGTVSFPWSLHTRSGVELKLTSVPNDIMPGTYEGTLIFTISSGQ